MNIRMLLVLMTSAFLSACDVPPPASKQAGKAPAAISPPAPVVRQHDFEQVQRGAQLFQQSCAQCHGQQGEGAPNWRQRNADGKFPPPPLNGSGHTWHHPMQALKFTIKNGTEKIGGSMPAWKGKLSDEEINDIIAWFQSKWPDEIYSAWYQNDQRARKRQ